ncbi:MAG: lysostaphin resistance A-like protein [bacterium]
MIIYKINKKDNIVCFFMLTCLLGYVFFPAGGFFQYQLTSIIFLILLPFIFSKYFLHKNLFKCLKFKIEKINSLRSLAIGLMLSFVLIALLFEFTDLGMHYLLSPVVKNNFFDFLLYEFTGVAFTLILYEIFFRGFVMGYFKESIGAWSILIQFLFFLVMIGLLNLPYWFFVLYLIFTPFAGLIYYATNSIIYSFLGQLFFIILVDATFIALTVK